MNNRLFWRNAITCIFSDLFPVTLKFDYEEIGGVTVYVELWNQVSKTVLKYNFTMVEKIENILLNAESIFSGTTNLLTSSVEVEEEENVKFIVTVDAGSHVEYSIDFGDGFFDTKKSQVLLAKQSFVTFSHRYKEHGVYDVNITAKNLINSVSRFCSSSIKVYELVANVSNTVKMIQFNEELYGQSIFDGLSEIFSVLLGVDASIK